MDDNILNDFDKDDDVRKQGRSAIFRKLASEYLRLKREKKITAFYTEAYGSPSDGLGPEYEGWEDEGAWPGI